MKFKMKKILIIDNYDSFTYNLVQIVDENFKGTYTIKRNDEIEIAEVEAYDGIILSPGPGIPDEAGLLKQIIETYGPTKKIFGVCLGLQAIGEVYGAKLKNLDKVYHGVKTKMSLINKPDFIFDGIPSEFEAGRYHSWIVDKEGLPESIEITCVDENNEIMAARHKEFDVRGVQFHPESILTEHGQQMIINFLNS
ncbi:MAG: aminodeoxychorismate/anthranilate synthase component II [Bacteroidales bacterium]|jgi:anthranilate synthase component 2|nr:aminodeoxychorismate/anthranilate synthase component II [Bacteroidales bacterium]